MINPTNENYSFHWYEIKKHPAITVSPFSCSKHSGHLQSRKEMEVKFNFTPPNTGVFESQWILSIPTREIKKLIILIGTASEPNVSFVPSYLKLKPTLKGVTAIGSVALVNNEDTDLSFFIEKSSLLSEGSAFLEVDPMQGILEAHSQKLLSINMIPTDGGVARLKLRVRVQKLKQPLVLTVDGECFIIEPVLTYECSSKERVDMTTEEDNFINLGTLTSRIPENLIFTLTNVGKPTIYYCWAWDSEAFEKACVSVNCFCLRGTVTSHSKATLRVQLTPLRKVAFKNIRLTLESTKGPHYNILLSGTAAVPLYKFSFDNYNFGLCFVQTSKSKYYRTGLVFHNKDEVPLILENKSEDSDAFTVEMTQSKVPARGELVIPIYFHPMMCQPYEAVITFSVNNFFTFNLVLSGEVAELNVELVKKSDRLISFGSVVKGHTASRTVEVINKSRVSLSGHFTIVSNNKENSDKPDIVVEPSLPITMIPNKIVKLLILYAPHLTTKSFIKHVIMTFQDMKQIICTIKGSCIGAELSLDRYYIPFGSIVLGNHSATRLMLINTGDLTVKFVWRVKNTREFTISPQEGYSTSGSETLLTVNFCPERLQAEIRTEAICEIDKFNDLKLTLTGSCVDLPPPIDTILFSCPVRKYEEKHVTLNNNLGLAVWFSPVISGEYFSTDRIIEIKPYSSANLSVVYSPLQMTEPEKVHEGILTIPLEGGSCLLYVLQGSAEEPEAEASVLVKTTTHKNTTKLLSVSNWLLTSQRFLATIKPLEGDFHVIYLISGNDYIDVPSKQCRDYTVNFMCFQPCMITFQVKFKNESSEEYQWYDLCFEVSQCNPIDELKMTTSIRKPVTQSVHIENPLVVPALLEKFSSTSKNITCPNLPSSIEPTGKEDIVFQYLPFHLTEETAELKIASPQLGLMLYVVQLTALPPKMEPSVYISCELGQQASVTVCIHNNSAQEAKFKSSVSHSDIKVDKIAKALPNETIDVTIVYEPSSLDNETIYVKILSDETGEFIFPVITTCLLPKPSGPFIVHEESQLIIHFKNIFSETKTFSWYVESPEFSIDSSTATLESKQEIDILVEMTENISHEMRNSLPATSKLTVTISDLSLQHIKWNYYLRGIYKT